MPRIRVLREFPYAFRGVEVVTYLPGLVEAPSEVADVALAEGWAVVDESPAAAPPPVGLPDEPPADPPSSPAGNADEPPAAAPKAPGRRRRRSRG